MNFINSIPVILEINGYKIMYIHNDKNITSIHCYVNSGSIHETKEMSGILHLLEHMILESWKKCKKDSCDSFWSKKGIMSNGQTSATYTRYFITGLNNGNQKNLYEYVASIISDPKFTNRILEMSKKAISEELTGKMNESSWKLENEYYKSFNDNTEYGGYCRIMDYNLKLKILDIITLNDVYNIYNKWYNKDNLFISVVSNENINSVKNHMKKYLKNNPMIKYMPLPNINLLKTRQSFILYTPGIKKTTYLIGYLCNNPSSDIFVYKDLIKDVLIGDISSILFLHLRNKLNLIYGIQLYYEFGPGYIMSVFNVNCNFENTKKLIKEFFKIMENFKNGKFENKMLKRSKERIMMNDINRDLKNTEFINNFYCNQYVLTKNISNTPETCSDKIQNISKKYFVKLSNEIFNDEYLIACETKKI
jgi:predicted Zn-dependent peptidase